MGDMYSLSEKAPIESRYTLLEAMKRNIQNVLLFLVKQRDCERSINCQYRKDHLLPVRLVWNSDASFNLLHTFRSSSCGRSHLFSHHAHLRDNSRRFAHQCSHHLDHFGLGALDKTCSASLSRLDWQSLRAGCIFSHCLKSQTSFVLRRDYSTIASLENWERVATHSCAASSVHHL